MDSELARARLAKMEKEIAALERWQKDRLTNEHAIRKGVQAMQDNKKTPAEFDARTPAECPDTGVGLCRCGTRRRDSRKGGAIRRRSLQLGDYCQLLPVFFDSSEEKEEEGRKKKKCRMSQKLTGGRLVLKDIQNSVTQFETNSRRNSWQNPTCLPQFLSRSYGSCPPSQDARGQD